MKNKMEQMIMQNDGSSSSCSMLIRIILNLVLGCFFFAALLTESTYGRQLTGTEVTDTVLVRTL